MTIIVFIAACSIRTPLSLWMTAMVCDTVIITVTMIVRHIGIAS